MNHKSSKKKNESNQQQHALKLDPINNRLTKRPGLKTGPFFVLNFV